MTLLLLLMSLVLGGDALFLDVTPGYPGFPLFLTSWPPARLSYYPVLVCEIKV